MIAHHRPELEIEKAAIEAGEMTTLKIDGFAKVFQGVTTIEEIVRVI